MPTFTYACVKCGHRFDYLSLPTADGTKDEPRGCEKCGGEVERCVTAAGVKFEGRGFYETDYKK